MAFIGNTNTTQAFTPAVDYFSGNASTTAFTLSKPVASVAQVQAVIENVPQNPSSAFTVSGSTITFTSAPPSGTNNIYVYYTSPITQVIQPSQGTVGAIQLDTGNGGAGTGSVQLPSGTTAQRPAGTTPGQMRYNSTTGFIELYEFSSWNSVASVYSVDYLVIAGGAGGGRFGGGGGAGGYRCSVSGESSGGGASAEASISVVSGSAYSITVGAGGAGATSRAVNGASGSNSVFGAITSTGGGGGGSDTAGGAGTSGGSGGGSAYNSSTKASGTSGQGYAGGSGVNAGPNYGTGGGGGAGAIGADGTTTAGGNGGVGVQSSISGAATYRAGGGGGQSQGGTQGSGGNGGGGAGNNGSAATNGAANTGGGGGGTSDTTPGTGGSGVVIIRYLGAQRATGGTVTSSGGYTIHTFISSGTFTA